MSTEIYYICAEVVVHAGGPHSRRELRLRTDELTDEKIAEAAERFKKVASELMHAMREEYQWGQVKKNLAAVGVELVGEPKPLADDTPGQEVHS